MSVSQTLTEEFLGDGLAKAAELYEIVDEMLQVDKRFVGMSKYVANVKMFWTYAVPTAAAATGHLFFNPKFWDSLPTETRKTVVAHEIWHLLLRHSDRGEGMDRETYNIAADHVINLGLEEEGFTFDGTTPCKDAKYKGKSTEEIYSIIYAKKKKNPDNPETKGQPHPSPDELEDLVKQAIEGSGKDIQQVADQDAKEADDAVGKGIGTCAGGENLILVADSQKVFIKEATYHEIFEDYLIDPLSGGKRTFLRPSRRQQPGGMRLPGRFKKRGKHNRLTHLVYALDVSGSISKAQAQQFQRSAKTLKETLNPERMTVILWDTRIVF
jgi:predicted metal-dependent peptidase